MRLLILAALVLLLVGAGVVVAYSPGGTSPVLPDTTAKFSLDLDVVGTLEHDTVYAVEQRSRPNYRIFAFEPATGEDETVFTVPEDAIVYGIALSPDRSTLAVAYSSDFRVNGSGLSLLDLASGGLREVVSATPEVFLTDPVWATDSDDVLATKVDRRGSDQQLSVAAVSIADGTVNELAANAVSPAVVGDDVYFLRVGTGLARRSIGQLDAAGNSSTINIDDREQDLDHLVAGAWSGELSVAVLDSQQAAGVTLGTAAEAHGNHHIPSTWWHVPLDGSHATTASGEETTVVYDAAAAGDAIVSADREGLSFTVDGTRHQLIASRAIRFVAAPTP